MKKYLTPRNLTYAGMALVLVWMLWPTKKAIATVTTTTVVPRQPRPKQDPQSESWKKIIPRFRPENYAQTTAITPAPSAERMGPSLRMKDDVPPTPKETLFQLQEREHESSKVSLT